MGCSVARVGFPGWRTGTCRVDGGDLLTAPLDRLVDRDHLVTQDPLAQEAGTLGDAPRSDVSGLDVQLDAVEVGQCPAELRQRPERLCRNTAASCRRTDGVPRGGAAPAQTSSPKPRETERLILLTGDAETEPHVLHQPIVLSTDPSRRPLHPRQRGGTRSTAHTHRWPALAPSARRCHGTRAGSLRPIWERSVASAAQNWPQQHHRGVALGCQCGVEPVPRKPTGVRDARRATLLQNSFQLVAPARVMSLWLAQSVLTRSGS